MKNETTLKLEGDRTIVITRMFNAPPPIVFEAWTKAEVVRKWWAPKSRATIVSVEADVRVGGTYRYVLKPHQGPEFAFSGTYSEVTPSSRLVYTHVFEPNRAAGGAVVTVTFEERGGKTLLTSREVFPSKEIRTLVIDTGMEPGMRETMDQLDALVSA